MIKKTILVSILNIIGFVSQFLLSIIISTKFGLGFELDVYNKSVVIPNYLIVLVSSCITYIFIPLYSNINKSKKQDSEKIINDYFISIFFLALFLVFIANLFSKQLINLFINKSDLIEYDIFIKVFIIYTPIILISTLIEFLNTVFYSNGIFKFPLIMKIVNPVLIGIIIYFFENKSVNIAFAYLISYFLQFVSLFFMCNNRYFKLNFKISVDDIIRRNKSILFLSAPLIFSIVLTKTLPIFDVYFLSKFNKGIISNVLLSQKLITAISFVVSSLFSVLFFSQLSNLASEKKNKKLFQILFFAINTILFLTIPMIFFLLQNSEVIFSFMFKHGKFDSKDIIELTKSFKIFLFVLPSMAIGSVISYAIYSLKFLNIFYFSSIVEIFTYVLFAYLFHDLLEYNSIPFAFTINFIVSDSLLFIYLYRQINKREVIKFDIRNIKILFFSMVIFLPYFILAPSLIFVNVSLFLFSCIFYFYFLYKFRFSPVILLANNYFRKR
jgi:peptidoglycan biosynthesis protein MviN/MurJ (putative lipid II flippase)